MRAAAWVVCTVRMVPCDTYAAAVKTTTHPKTRCRKPHAATQNLIRLMMGVCARNMSSCEYVNKITLLHQVGIPDYFMRKMHRQTTIKLKTLCLSDNKDLCSTSRCMLSGFSREVDEICAAMGYYGECIGNSLPTFRDLVSVPPARVKKFKKFLLGSQRSFFLDLLTLEDGTDRLFRNVAKELPPYAA